MKYRNRIEQNRVGYIFIVHRCGKLSLAHRKDEDSTENTYTLKL